ncbi:MAG: alginate lyase family protein [Candidatus Omnitrophota bacterium]
MLNDRLLREYNFFELYPFDGGGGLIFNEMLGTIKDEEIYRKIIKENVLSEFGSLPEIDFKKFERWRSIEKSCWLNRFYFMASLSRIYWLRKDEKIARLIKKIVIHFLQKYPPPQGKKEIGDHINYVYGIRDNNYNKQTYEENQRDETDVKYIWFDFQPASRLIHLIYLAHFLKDSKSVTKSEWEKIRESIYKHAEIIMIGEKYFRKLSKGDNHQSVRGIALLHAGCFFKNYGAGKDFIKEGVRICNFHTKIDFLPDGTLAENSPSYHVFETWHVRDAFILSQRYNFRLRSETPKTLKKSALFINAICQPDGCSPVINDGYPVNLSPFLKSLPFKAEPKKNDIQLFFFEDASIGVYKDKKRYLTFDASPYTGQFSHYHAGKNSFIYWYDKKPFFVDSGCCSYDDKLFAKWYKQGESHSSLLVNGNADGIVKGTYRWMSYATVKCDGWNSLSGNHIISSNLKSNAAGWEGVSWNRAIKISKNNSITITDVVNTKTPKDLMFVLNLHPDVRITKNNKAILLNNRGTKLAFNPKVSKGDKIEVSISRGKCFMNFEHVENKRILLKTKTNGKSIMEIKIESAEINTTILKLC